MVSCLSSARINTEIIGQHRIDYVGGETASMVGWLRYCAITVNYRDDLAITLAGLKLDRSAAMLCKKAVRVCDCRTVLRAMARRGAIVILRKKKGRLLIAVLTRRQAL